MVKEESVMRYWQEHPEEYEAIKRGGGDPHDAFKGAQIVGDKQSRIMAQKKKTRTALALIPDSKKEEGDLGGGSST